jgi:hypothetical protein
MPSYWKWFSYLDFMRYAWSALMVNQFSGPQGDPIFLNGQTVLEHYQLKNYTDHSSAHYTWYRKTVVRARMCACMHACVPRLFVVLTTCRRRCTCACVCVCAQDKWANVGFLILFFFVYFMLAWWALAHKTFSQR